MNTPTIGLARFTEAQDQVYETVLDELANGHKATHWMWFIFTQFKELGRSPVAKYFGINSYEEALDFCQHPILGKRLVECIKLLLAGSNDDVHEIFGFPDDLKFRSCITLFSVVAPVEPVFKHALARFFDGKPDAATLTLLAKKV